MSEKRWHLFLPVISMMLIITLGFTFTACQPQADHSSSSEAEETKAVSRVLDYSETDYTVNNNGENKITLTNRYDGFSVDLPADYKEDVNVSAVATEAGNGKEDVSIFFEQLKSEDEAFTYRNYSNSPIMKSTDSIVSRTSKKTEEGRVSYKLFWHRNTMNVVDNDKPYYCCVDLLYVDASAPESEGKYLDYTLYFRSEEPVDEQKIDDICNSFRLTERKEHTLTAEPKNKTQDLNLRSYWAENTKKFYTSHFSKDASVDWGIYNPDYWETDYPDRIKLLSQLESETDSRFDVLVRYCNFSEDGLTDKTFTDLDNAGAEDRCLELTLQTAPSNGGDEFYKLMNGTYDGYIEEMAAAVRDRRQPVLLRICNEMNGDWCGYSAYNYARDTELYIEMYRHIYHKFEECGALPYTIFVWNPNEKSMPDYKWNHEYRYYPGDDYVDVVGLTGYNTGTYYDGETWRTFDEIYRKPYMRDVVNYSQPLMITEFACSSVGGNKVKWMKNMFDVLPDYDRIKIAVWWNSADYDGDKVARPYWFDETKDTLKAFKEGVNKIEGNSGSSGSGASAG